MCRVIRISKFFGEQVSNLKYNIRGRKIESYVQMCSVPSGLNIRCAGVSRIEYVCESNPVLALCFIAKPLAWKRNAVE